MKRLFACILIGALLSLLFPSAFADTPEIVAVYAAADISGLPDEGGDEEPDATILYCFDDDTYKQYIIRGGRCELYRQGRGDPAGGPGLGQAALIQIYKKEESETMPPTIPTEEEAEPVTEIGAETFDEGPDTGIKIDGYTKYSGSSSPYFLSAGDKIAVLSPSALPGREQAEKTAEGLRSWGFEPVLGKHAYGQVSTLEECLEDFREALADPEIKAIFCVRGGYGATEVMDALGDDLIAGAGKPIIGYSDITAFHGAWTCAGLPSIHASMSAAFDDFPEACAEAEQNMMKGEIPTYRCEARPGCKQGTAEGILIGGNLSTLTACLDTAYDCTKLDQPFILFLEEVGENMQHIHRYLTILKHKGILDKAAGLVFGEWTELPADGRGNYGEARGGLFESVADMISRQFLDGVDVPVMFGFPGGHGETNYPLLMGATAKIEVSEQSCTISWPQPETEQNEEN